MLRKAAGGKYFLRIKLEYVPNLSDSGSANRDLRTMQWTQLISVPREALDLLKTITDLRIDHLPRAGLAMLQETRCSRGRSYLWSPQISLQSQKQEAISCPLLPTPYSLSITVAVDMP